MDRVFGKKSPSGKFEVERVDDLSVSRAFSAHSEAKRAEKAAEAERRLDVLEKTVAAAADLYHEELEKLESAEAQGEAVPENRMSEARDKAVAYGNLMAAFRRAQGSGAERIAAISAALHDESAGWSAYGKMKAEELVRDLHEMLN